MKKLIYGLGTIAATVTPVVAVVSCGKSSQAESKPLHEAFDKAIAYIKDEYNNGHDKSGINQVVDLTRVTLSIDTLTKVHKQEAPQAGDLNLVLDKHTYLDTDTDPAAGAKPGEETWRWHGSWQDVVFYWNTFKINLTCFSDEEFAKRTKVANWEQHEATAFGRFAKNFKTLGEFADKIESAVEKLEEKGFKLGGKALSKDNFFTKDDKITVEIPEFDQNGAPADPVVYNTKLTKEFKVLA